MRLRSEGPVDRWRCTVRVHHRLSAPLLTDVSILVLPPVPMYRRRVPVQHAVRAACEGSVPAMPARADAEHGNRLVRDRVYTRHRSNLATPPRPAGLLDP